MTGCATLVITAETIILSRTSASMPVLGPDLELLDCTVVNELGSDVVVAGLTMSGGTWRQVDTWANDQLDRAWFRNVRFEGSFTGLTFGNWDDPGAAGTEGCDFSAARIDGLRFLHGAHVGLARPGWPCFAVHHPHEAVDALAEMGLDPLLTVNLNSLLDQDPRCTLVVDDARRISKRRGVPLDRLRDIIAALPGASTSP